MIRLKIKLNCSHNGYLYRFFPDIKFAVKAVQDGISVDHVGVWDDKAGRHYDANKVQLVRSPMSYLADNWKVHGSPGVSFKECAVILDPDKLKLARGAHLEPVNRATKLEHLDLTITKLGYGGGTVKISGHSAAPIATVELSEEEINTLIADIKKLRKVNRDVLKRGSE